MLLIAGDLCCYYYAVLRTSYLINVVIISFTGLCVESIRQSLYS